MVGTSAVVVGVLSRYLARRRAKPIMNPRIQRAINKRISRMRSPNGGKDHEEKNFASFYKKVLFWIIPVYYH